MKFKRILSTALAAVTLSGVLAVMPACNDKGNGGNVSSSV